MRTSAGLYALACSPCIMSVDWPASSPLQEPRKEVAGAAVVHQRSSRSYVRHIRAVTRKSTSCKSSCVQREKGSTRKLRTRQSRKLRASHRSNCKSRPRNGARFVTCHHSENKGSWRSRCPGGASSVAQ
ncbi:hypothetical protein MRX96_007092 [Rhipicephalus microplus]